MFFREVLYWMRCRRASVRYHCRSFAALPPEGLTPPPLLLRARIDPFRPQIPLNAGRLSSIAAAQSQGT